MRRSHPYPVNPHQDGMTVAAFYGGMAGCSVLIIAVFVALLWVLWPGAARAHDALPTAAMPQGWTYPWGCCSNQDCRQATDGEVREVVKGYLLTTSGEIVPYGDKRIKDSPDGMFHACQQGGNIDKGRVLCLFVPPRSY